MPIGNLPNEILQEIFQQLGDRNGLVNLSRCNKFFNKVSEPILYSTFAYKEMRVIAAFIQTISTKPHLLQHVKHFYAYCWEERSGDPAIELEHNQHIRNWIRGRLPNHIFGHEFCQKWFSPMFDPWNWDPFMAFLLILFSDSLLTIKISGYGTPQPFLYIDAVLLAHKVVSNDQGIQIFLPKLYQVDLRTTKPCTEKT